MATAYIVHRRTHHRANYGKSYSSVGRAQAAINKSPNKYPPEEYVAMSAEQWREEDTYVTVTNMMSKEPVQIRRSEVGTCCDPSTERYWAM